MDTGKKVLLVLAAALIFSATANSLFVIVQNTGVTGVTPTWKIEAWNGNGVYIGDTAEDWNRDDLVLAGIVTYKATVTNPTAAGLKTIESVTLNVYNMLPTGGAGTLAKSHTFTVETAQVLYSCAWNTNEVPNGDYFLTIVAVYTAATGGGSTTMFSMIAKFTNAGGDPAEPGTDYLPYLLGAGGIALLVIALRRRGSN